MTRSTAASIRLTPGTLKALNDRVVAAAVKLGLEDGGKLRVDTTVVETDIRHPTDSTLLWDVVRVLTRHKGNPADEVHVAPSLKRHRRMFRRAPALYGAERSFFSENNVATCARGAVTTACIPQRGGRKTPQRQA
jgi:hypothetical protein